MIASSAAAHNRRSVLALVDHLVILITRSRQHFTCKVPVPHKQCNADGRSLSSCMVTPWLIPNFHVNLSPAKAISLAKTRRCISRLSCRLKTAHVTLLTGISNAYLKTKDDMRYLVDQLSQIQPVARPLTGAQLSGRWELVYTTVELFRASPFFQMVSE